MHRCLLLYDACVPAAGSINLKEDAVPEAVRDGTDGPVQQGFGVGAVTKLRPEYVRQSSQAQVVAQTFGQPSSDSNVQRA